MTTHALNIPNPDPSLLTTSQLHREIAGLREIIEVRLSGMDRATQLLSEAVVARQLTTDQQISHLAELHAEKFASIDGRILDRDVRVEQATSANKTIFDSALQALKETAWAQNAANAAAITKAEIATVKQIDGLHAIIQNSSSALSARVGDLKERLDRDEASSLGARDRKSEQRLTTSSVATIIGVFVVTLSALAGLLGFSMHH